jgi:hypothetical protein
MTIYEQVQLALDHIEENLTAPLRQEDVALEVGYQSHESFCRAFKAEFGLSPTRFRSGRPGRVGLERLFLIKELYMGVIVKDLPEMMVVAFDGFAPAPEDKAKAGLSAWRAAHPERGKPRRVFGHNIDAAGNIDCNPHNVGYRFMASLDGGEEAGEAATMTIAAGRFAVTGIEGSFQEDPTGAWIGAGWERMNAMIREKGLKVKSPPRWYEEELEPQAAGNLRLDLYLEIES